ncbi:hypothetical protein BKH41_08575 [Helicobacter sp. 12S02232-10]|uniref:replication initiation protein n=1 Tax=Helicobacter sp. 12S02232-10 TaxID=1476197 RepID=UPI000BA7C152|nr:replication initiation protein [Helicobacter sp. 12S02232-10]PAF46754.1 hypothetical protein BKH41_08575 [Helicobacter sp. 12S02232-10]
MNEVVKYHNDINLIAFKDFTEADLNNFFAVCHKMKNEGSRKVTMSFEELKSLSGYKKKDDKEFALKLEKIYDKILALSLGLKEEKVIDKFNLFNKFTINLLKKTLTIQINEEFLYILNSLSGNFTRFELEEFCNISSKYAKNLYRNFKQWKTTGESYFTWEEFKAFLSIPDTYTTGMIDKRIINPSVEELKNIFFDLNVTKIKGKGRGRGGQIEKIKFTFLPEKWEVVPHPKMDSQIPEQQKAFQNLHSFKNYICKKFAPAPNCQFCSFTKYGDFQLFIKSDKVGKKYLAKCYYSSKTNEYIEAKLESSEAITIWINLLEKAKRGLIPELQPTLL